MSKETSGTTELIFSKFSGLVELCKGLINPEFIWRSLKRCCHDNQLVTKFAFFHGPIFIIAQPFRNGLEYSNACGQLRSRLIVATLCTNLVRFDAVTLDKNLLIFVLV